MRFNHLQYVPCLRWKQGEYQAVQRLLETTKNGLIPLIELPEIGWDFEERRQAKTVDDHIAPFPRRVHAKWKERPCFVDLHLLGSTERMASGVHPIRFVFTRFREMECPAIPVTGVTRDVSYQQETKRVLDEDKRGLCLRVSIEQAAKNSLRADADSLLATFGVRVTDCDFILDVGAPNFVPLDGFSKVVQAIVMQLPHLAEWRTFTLVGTSFPETMTGIKTGGEVIPRYEWQLYRMLVPRLSDMKARLPAFGDYVISHPRVLPHDMRLLKPYATIRYTIDDAWYVIKGKNVRDYKFEQYRELSRRVVNSRHYCGSTFSWGDDYILRCADGTGKTGNLSTWRQVGTNHHIEKVIRDIASIYGFAGTP
jgi:hypothetical protein